MRLSMTQVQVFSYEYLPRDSTDFICPLSNAVGISSQTKSRHAKSFRLCLNEIPPVADGFVLEISLEFWDCDLEL